MRQPVPFGKYLLLDRISVGGMAEVFKAKSYGVEGFEKIIAIKRILPTMGEDRDFIKMFIDEAKIAGQLAHANICQIFELGRIDGSHFIAMEYIWGKDLLQIQNRIRKLKQQMPVPMACFVIAKVLEGLDYAHRKRDPLGRPLEIVHRDCSPQNVLVSYEGEVKVIDFGIAKATSRNSRTMAGVLKGKFGYMSPEQVRGLPLDRRSDIFALGTMLYECLTGERLFQGETDFSTLEKVRNVDVQLPRQVNPAIPESIEKVILKALAKDVEDRYQWCSEMLADLQQYLMSQDVVFTAKSLSTWLKDGFAQEIERERQLLEQYKRVGRDGLIAGVPAAVAKVDVVETLGEAGAPEGDATQLGGPSFEDIEKELAAKAEPESAGPAPIAPAAGRAASPAVGAGRAASPAVGAGRAASPAAAPRKKTENEEDDGFGEEAPTEIFGELEDDKVAQVLAATPGRSPTPPVGSRPPTKAPPRPPGAPLAGPQPLAAVTSNTPRPQVMQGATPPSTGGAEQPFVPASATPAAGYAAQPPQGFPNLGATAQGPVAVPNAPLNATSPQLDGLMANGNGNGNGQAKTLLGAVAPAGLGNYGGGYTPPVATPSNPAMQPYGGQPANPNEQNPGYPQYANPSTPGGYPSYPGYPDPYASQQGYASGQQPNFNNNPYASGPSAAVDPNAPQQPVEGKKKSSIGRDVAIGVAIAAVVLGGFLAVKFLVLDKDQGETTAGAADPAASQIATIEIEMPDGITAEFFVDDKRIATVENGRKLPVTAGLRKIKLLAASGSRCEQPIELPAGETRKVQCIMFAGSGSGSAVAAAGSGSASEGSGSAMAGSAGSGSAAMSGSAAGSGSAAVKVDPAAKAAADKAAADKAVADKAAADKLAADKLAADKLAAKLEADKLKAEKLAADKAAAEKARLEKLKAERDKTKTGTGTGTTASTGGTGNTKTTGGTGTTSGTGGSSGTSTTTNANAKGYLNIFSKPSGVKVAIDGTDTGMVTPISKGIPLTPGKHKVTFTVGTDRHTFSVMIKPGVTETLSRDLK